MRLAGLAKGGYYPTPMRVVELIAAQVTSRRTRQYSQYQPVLRILDPCCGPAEAVTKLGEIIPSCNYQRPPCDIYGVELEDRRSAAAAEAIDHILPSDLFQTQISNKSFSLLFLNPPYDFEQEAKRAEHAFLTHCTPHLTTGGLLVFIVPRHRLAVSTRYLAANYKNIAVFRFPDPEYEVFDQVVLFGNKTETPQLDEHAEARIREISLGPVEPVHVLGSPTSNYRIFEAPCVPNAPIIFTTRSIDPAAAANEARQNGLWNSQSIIDRFWPQEHRKERPLMPLRKGHLAQLVAAGFLDNLLLEEEDERLLIKGRTTKESVLVESTPDKDIYQDKMRTTVVVLDLDSGKMTDIKT